MAITVSTVDTIKNANILELTSLTCNDLTVFLLYAQEIQNFRIFRKYAQLFPLKCIPECNVHMH